MAYHFREIRRADIPDALAFAGAQGLEADEAELRHHLSLVVKQQGAVVAAALCFEIEPGRYAMRFVVAIEDAGQKQALTHELADRSLRKFQAEGIGMTRLSGVQAEAEALLWNQVNWLDRIQSVTPPGVVADADAEASDPPPSAASAQPQPAQSPQAA